MIPMLKKGLLWIIYGLSIAVTLGCIVYFGPDIFKLILQMSWWLVGVLVLLHLPVLILNGFAFDKICKSIKIDLYWKDWLGLSFITTFLNQLLPYRPGIGFRYFYLHRRYHVKVTQFISIFLIYLFFILLISALFILMGWALSDLPQASKQLPQLAMGILLLSLVAWVILFAWRIFLSSAWNFMEKLAKLPFLHNTLTTLSLLTHQPKLTSQIFLAFLLSNGFNVIIFYLLFKSMDMPLAIADCVFLVGVMSIAMLFPITPGNIGVLETAMGTLTHFLYQDFSVGFSVIALYRATQWIPSAFFGILFSFLLVGKIFPPFKTLNIGSLRRVD